MSLSAAPSVQITFRTAQDISDEILGGVIQFCRKNGYKQNTTLLTFFWSAFLLSAKEDLEKNKIVDDVMRCYIRSLSWVFPKLSEDEAAREKVTGMCKHYWETLSPDFSLFNAEKDVAALLQVANKLNGQSNLDSSKQTQAEVQNDFWRMASAIRSSVYRILYKVENGFCVEYRHVLDEFRAANMMDEPKGNQQENAGVRLESEPADRVNEGGKPLGMKWYKFLTKFALIAGAVVNFVTSLNYFTGAIYEIVNERVTAEMVYAYYGGMLKIVDVAYGLFLVVFGLLAINLRKKLADYDPAAPKGVCILYSLAAGGPFVYSILVAAITSQSLSGNVFGTLLGSLLFLHLNAVYFKKRAHLFAPKGLVHESDTPRINREVSPPVTTSAPQISFCRNCGQKLIEGSKFCSYCGTAVLKE